MVAEEPGVHGPARVDVLLAEVGVAFWARLGKRRCPRQKHRQDRVQDDRWPQEDAGEIARHAEVGEIQRDSTAIRSASRPGACPASRRPRTRPGRCLARAQPPDEQREARRTFGDFGNYKRPFHSGSFSSVRALVAVRIGRNGWRFASTLNVILPRITNWKNEGRQEKGVQPSRLRSFGTRQAGRLHPSRSERDARQYILPIMPVNSNSPGVRMPSATMPLGIASLFGFIRGCPCLIRYSLVNSRAAPCEAARAVHHQASWSQTVSGLLS